MIRFHSLFFFTAFLVCFEQVRKKSTAPLLLLLLDLALLLNPLAYRVIAKYLLIVVDATVSVVLCGRRSHIASGLLS